MRTSISLTLVSVNKILKFYIHITKREYQAISAELSLKDKELNVKLVL